MLARVIEIHLLLVFSRTKQASTIVPTMLCTLPGPWSVPYLWNGPLYRTLAWGMRWKSDSEVWNGYGTGMVRSCKISRLVFLTRAIPGTWTVPYLWNGPRYHTQGRVWNGRCSIPMERTLFHSMVQMGPPGFVPYLFKKIVAI